MVFFTFQYRILPLLEVLEIRCENLYSGMKISTLGTPAVAGVPRVGEILKKQKIPALGPGILSVHTGDAECGGEHHADDREDVPELQKNGDSFEDFHVSSRALQFASRYHSPRVPLTRPDRAPRR